MQNPAHPWTTATMCGSEWSASARVHERIAVIDTEVPLSDGERLRGKIFIPRDVDRVPVILGCHPYNNDYQVAPILPIAFPLQRGFLEAGDPYFYARHGYAHAIFNVRGTGASTGTYQFMGPREAQDVAELIAWLGRQEWSSGHVGMFGVSYFAWLQKQVAGLNPEHLDCIFAPWGAVDFYRDVFYHGGVLAHQFLTQWTDKWDNPRCESWSKRNLPDYEDRIRHILSSDDEIRAFPRLVTALEQPDAGTNPCIVDVLLNSLDGDFYRERRSGSSRVPAYLGACWGNYGLHLAGAFRSWDVWEGPKLLRIGPPLYLDRPVWQYQYESLRWFDHWLRQQDTGLMQDAPVRVYIPGRDEWIATGALPLRETKWTPFFLHQSGLLSEHEPWIGEGRSSFYDSPFMRGSLEFRTSPFAENVVMLGPAYLSLSFESTDDDAILVVSLSTEDVGGVRTEITRGWLRASQRAIDEEKSTPWMAHYPHNMRKRLTPGSCYRVVVALDPAARSVARGERLVLRISGSDQHDPVPDSLIALAVGHVSRQGAHVSIINHEKGGGSWLSLPFVSGNVGGSYIEGDRRHMLTGPVPYGKLHQRKDIDWTPHESEVPYGGEAGISEL